MFLHSYLVSKYIGSILHFLVFRVEFTVGPKPVENFRMIERHYFKEKLLKSFDFTFGFCMPNSKNTCEHIYEFPKLSAEESKWYILMPFHIYHNIFARILARCEMCLNLTMKTPERWHWCRSGVFIVNFEHVSHLFLAFLLFTLNT